MKEHEAICMNEWVSRRRYVGRRKCDSKSEDVCNCKRMKPLWQQCEWNEYSILKDPQESNCEGEAKIRKALTTINGKPELTDSAFDAPLCEACFAKATFECELCKGIFWESEWRNNEFMELCLACGDEQFEIYVKAGAIDGDGVDEQ